MGLGDLIEKITTYTGINAKDSKKGIWVIKTRSVGVKLS